MPGGASIFDWRCVINKSTPNESAFNPCLIIPIYNHGGTIGRVLESVAPLGLKTVIVDDGSDEETRAVLEQLDGQHDWVRLLSLPVNQGKGAALRRAFELALEAGHSHAVQIDADDQHDVADIPAFVEAARRQPDALVAGEPVFRETAPGIRVFGHHVTRLWTTVASASQRVHDPLFGFRCYPLRISLALMTSRRIGQRMDFDPDMAIWFAKMRYPVANIPSQVRYYPDGISHFNYFADNVRIISMITLHILTLPFYVLGNGMKFRRRI